MGISVVIHTYNSEKYLEECLESVKSCEEIVICDMHSTDRTIEIAQKFGAKIIYHENVGFADPARNFALSHATQDWIFVLDSDEIIPQALLSYLRETVMVPSFPQHISAIFIPRKNIHLGEVLWQSYPNKILRFFKNGKVSFSDKVHCAPTVLEGGDFHIDPKMSDLAIIHYNHESLHSLIARMNTYTSLELEKYEQRGVKFSFALLFLRPTAEFFKKYFLKGGYKQGLYGFMFATQAFIYKFIAVQKLWEKEFKAKQFAKFSKIENPDKELKESTKAAL